MSLSLDSLREEIRGLFFGIFDGVKNATDLVTVLRVILSSKQLGLLTMKCVFINGFLFLGGIYLSEWVLYPQGQWLALIFMYWLWLWPLYVLSFVLNAQWYSFMAKEMKELLNLKSYPVLAFSIQEEIYRALFVGIALLQSNIIYWVPYVGPGLSFVLLSYIYSLYSFEYRLDMMNLDQKLSFIEERYAYFFGFGLPITVATFFLPWLAAFAIFALFFPIFLILSFAANPKRISSDLKRDESHISIFPQKLPVFWLPKSSNQFAITKFEGLIKRKTERLISKTS